MTDLEDCDEDDIILNAAEDPIVPDAVPPFAAAVRGETLAVDPRIGAALQVFSDPAQDQSGSRSVQLFDIA